MATVMAIILTLALVVFSTYRVVKDFIIPRRRLQVPCIYQKVCDPDVVFIKPEPKPVVTEIGNVVKTKSLEDLRREYREWVENCNHVANLKKHGAA